MVTEKETQMVAEHIKLCSHKNFTQTLLAALLTVAK